MTHDYTHTREPAGDALLMTGATGFLGQEILLRYLERSERPIYALIRAENDLHATERMRSILTSLFGDADPYLSRVNAVAADVETPASGSTMTGVRRWPRASPGSSTRPPRCRSRCRWPSRVG